MLGFRIPCAPLFGEIEIQYRYEVAQVRITYAKRMVYLSCLQIIIFILRHLGLLSLLATILITIAGVCRRHHQN